MMRCDSNIIASSTSKESFHEHTCSYMLFFGTPIPMSNFANRRLQINYMSSVNNTFFFLYLDIYMRLYVHIFIIYRLFCYRP